MKSKPKLGFSAKAYLDTMGPSRTVREFAKKHSIFVQGEAADTLVYIQKGAVKFTVVNHLGKEAVVAIFRDGEFFGEGVLTGQTIRMGTATALEPTTALFIERNEMTRVLHDEHSIADLFIKHMVTRNLQVEGDLIDQLFNSTEKRLARTLLLLARYGMEGQPKPALERVSQETLAEMIGTTRTRVNFFMNKFRKLGFIEYNGGITVNKSLLTVVLHE